MQNTFKRIKLADAPVGIRDRNELRHLMKGKISRFAAFNNALCKFTFLLPKVAPTAIKDPLNRFMSFGLPAESREILVRRDVIPSDHPLYRSPQSLLVL